MLTRPAEPHLNGHAHTNGHAALTPPPSPAPSTSGHFDTSRPPPLDPEESAQLLAHFLEADCSLIELASRTGIYVDQLIEWAESPETIRRIEALERIAAFQARAVANLGRPVALGSLTAHVNANQYDETHQVLRPCPDTYSLVLRQRESARRAANTVAACCPTTLPTLAPRERWPRFAAGEGSISFVLYTFYRAALVRARSAIRVFSALSPAPGSAAPAPRPRARR